MRRVFLMILALIVVQLAGCKTHNTLVEKNETCTERWANIEANLQRRHDMIPNLVNVVKKYASHEEATFKAVAEARSKAIKIKLTAADLENADKLATLQNSQDELTAALTRLMAVRESHPNLKADRLFINLQTQIEGTENRLLRSRKLYNAAVRDFNTELDRAGGKIVNPATGNSFKRKPYFHASSAARTAPKVTF